MRVIAIFLAAVMSFTGAVAQQPSLAEHAASTRSSGNGLAPEKAGSVVGNDYRNPYFGFEIRHLPGWESQTRGELNVNEAIGREALGQGHGISDSGRAFGMHDGRGSNLVLSIRALPPGANLPLNRRNEVVQAALKKAFPDPKFTAEPVPLGDRTHFFAAFRMDYVVRDTHVYQSSQATILKGHLLDFTITSNSEVELTDVLRKLQAGVKWTD